MFKFLTGSPATDTASTASTATGRVRNTITPGPRRRLFGSSPPSTGSEPTQKTRKHQSYTESPYYREQVDPNANPLESSILQLKDKDKAFANSGKYSYFYGWKPTTNTHILTYLDNILQVLQNKEFVVTKDDAHDNMPNEEAVLTEKDMGQLHVFATAAFKNGTDAEIEQALMQLTDPTQNGSLRFAALEVTLEGLDDETAKIRALAMLERLKASYAQNENFRKKEAERQMLKQHMEEIYGAMLLENKKEHRLRQYPLYFDEMQKLIEYDDKISKRRR